MGSKKSRFLHDVIYERPLDLIHLCNSICWQEFLLWVKLKICGFMIFSSQSSPTPFLCLSHQQERNKLLFVIPSCSEKDDIQITNSSQKTVFLTFSANFQSTLKPPISSLSFKPKWFQMSPVFPLIFASAQKLEAGEINKNLCTHIYFFSHAMSVDIILLHRSASLTTRNHSRIVKRRKKRFLKIRKFWKNSKSIRSLIAGPGK